MESTKNVEITEYLSEWEVMLQNHPGRITLNCLISIADKDLIVKCVVTLRSGLIAFNKTPTAYLVQKIIRMSQCKIVNGKLASLFLTLCLYGSVWLMRYKDHEIRTIFTFVVKKLIHKCSSDGKNWTLLLIPELIA